MPDHLDDFRLQLRMTREESTHQPLNFYSRKMSESQEKAALEAVLMMQPWVDAFVASDKKLHLQENASKPFIYHILYDNSKHCRISIGASDEGQVYVNAMVGGSFNLQHLAVYAGPLDEETLGSATRNFLVRCYRFLLTGQLAC